jgi:hypothetical protein
MCTTPRKPFLPTRTDLKRLARLNGLVFVCAMPVMLVFVLLFAKNVRTAGDVSAAILVHAAFFGIGLLLIRWGRPTG